MKLTKGILTGILIISIFGFLSCKREPSCEGCADNNKPPIANAGPDQTHYWRTNTTNLEGSASDPDGSISVYRWFKLSGPSYSQNKIDNPTRPKTHVTDLEPGMHQFLFTVSDDKGAISTDTIMITVIDTLTTSGKEYIFNELPWNNYYDEYSGRVYNDIVIYGDLFYHRDKKIEVSILVANTTNWQTLTRSSPFTSAGLAYSAGGLMLYVVNLFQSPAEDLSGTKASIKVKFL